MLTRLFVPRRRKNQQEVAGRAAEVIQQVLFDVGVDRFLNGTVLLDPQFRLRFFSAASSSPLTRCSNSSCCASMCLSRFIEMKLVSWMNPG